MDRIHYTPEDFCRDESYLNYYFRKNAADIQSWEDWISRHPEKLDVIVAADHLIAMLSLRLPEENFLREQDRTLGPIRESASTNNPTPEPRPQRKTTVRWASAAAIIILISSIFFFRTRPAQTKEHTKTIDPAATMTQQIANTGNTDKHITLEDGSQVTLEKGATLTLPQHFAAAKREVSLEGNAFFDISRNASRPFYIFSRNIVTHVIGTSFYIRQDPVNRKLEVSVVTGKVEVYEKAAQDNATRVSNGVILVPNQKVVYGEDQQHFETSLTDNPIPVQRENNDTTAGKQTELIQHPIDAPVSLSDVLTAIGQQYGISIAVENDNIYNCHFSGDLTGLGLYEKMDIVCRSVGATYKIRGTQILIRGNGCGPAK